MNVFNSLPKRTQWLISSASSLLLILGVSILFFGNDVEHDSEEWLHTMSETVRADLLYVHPERHDRAGGTHGAHGHH